MVGMLRKNKFYFNGKKLLILMVIFALGLCFNKTTFSAGVQEELLAQPPQFMKFKLGFEFQEINGLCPWALEEATVNKRPLFQMIESCLETHQVRTLWRLEIDGTDLEFVTSPFSHKESQLLQNSLRTISFAFQVLEDLLKDRESITFDDWLEKMEGISCCPVYKMVGNKSICPHQGWRPQFAPQVTIQHPLECAIPISYGLLGFDSPEMLNFSCALPYADVLRQALKQNDLTTVTKVARMQCTKINGLVFLHALTLVQMTPIDGDETNLLEETVKSLEQYNQVDVKRKLALMSRRPFSSMLSDIESSFKGSYKECFSQGILRYNPRFSSFSEVPTLFSKTEYGTEFRDKETGLPVSLTKFISSFESDYVDRHKKTLLALLEKGVVTTSMIRHLQGEIRLCEEDYFQAALDIGAATHKRYSVEIQEDRLCVVAEESLDDALSPPWFLPKEDSMGYFKASLSEDELEFGEAIVEFRGIKDVGAWFMEKARLTDMTEKGQFLRKPKNIEKEGVTLFEFLKSFQPNDLIDTYRGIGYCIDRY